MNRPRAHRVGAFTLVEILVVVVIISVLSATVTVAMARGAVEQRTVATEQALSEVRSSIALYRARAVFEGLGPFPPIESVRDGGLLPSGSLPENPFTGLSGVSLATDLPSATARLISADPVGWVYYADTSAEPVAIFFANSAEDTERKDLSTGVAIPANEL